MITCLALSPSLDVSYLVDHLASGSISRPREIIAVAGGKALNVARVAARLGADVRAVAALGGHTGRRIADLLVAEGVTLDALPIAGETRTCISIAADDADDLTEVYEPSPPLDAATLAAVPAAVGAPRRPGADWLVFSGSLPGGVPPDRVAALLTDLRGAGWRLAVDTHSEVLAAILASEPDPGQGGVDLLKVNRAEASAVLHVPLDTPAIELAAGLRTATGGVVVVTDGIDGSVAIEGDRVIRVAPPTARGRFPVGSGDSYLGGLVVALERGDPLENALRLGAACAEANAHHPGAAQWPMDALDVGRVTMSGGAAGDLVPVRDGGV